MMLIVRLESLELERHPPTRIDSKISGFGDICTVKIKQMYSRYAPVRLCGCTDNIEGHMSGSGTLLKTNGCVVSPQACATVDPKSNAQLIHYIPDPVPARRAQTVSIPFALGPGSDPLLAQLPQDSRVNQTMSTSMPLSDIVAAYQSDLVNNYCIVAALTIVCYEFLITYECYNNSLKTFLQVLYNLPVIVLALFSALRVFALLERAYATAGCVLLLGLAPVGISLYKNSQNVDYYINDPVLGSSCYARSMSSSSLLFEYADFLHPMRSIDLGVAALSTAIAADVVAIVTTWIKTYRQVRQAAANGINASVSATLLQYGTLYFMSCTGVLSQSSDVEPLQPSFQATDPTAIFTNMLPNIILSRFLINLRQNDFVESTDAAHFSQFSVPNFRVPTLPEIIGNLGEPLADRVEELDDQYYPDVDVCEDCSNTGASPSYLGEYDMSRTPRTDDIEIEEVRKLFGDEVSHVLPINSPRCSETSYELDVPHEGLSGNVKLGFSIKQFHLTELPSANLIWVNDFVDKPFSTDDKQITDIQSSAKQNLQKRPLWMMWLDGTGADDLGSVYYAILGKVADSWILVDPWSSKAVSDDWFLRRMVAALCIVDSLHQALVIHLCYYYLVLQYGNPAALGTNVWSMSAQMLLNIIIAFFVQTFLVIRVWKLSRNLWIAIVCELLALASLGVYFYCPLTLFMISELSVAQEKMQPKAVAGLSIALIADLAIAAATSFYLYRSRTGFRRSDGMIARLIGLTFTTGLLTTCVQLVIFVLLLADKRSFYDLAVGFIIKFSVRLMISCVSSLNSRELISGRTGAQDFEFMALSALRKDKTIESSPHAISVVVSHTDGVDESKLPKSPILLAKSASFITTSQPVTKDIAGDLV
ncbi:hypothetical protein NM688_g904 [Phlebia brevispora]|uniref:Uncharacterized protein n=1 Tax=Phlebia brevispora TaxID=194682 RepID=A0ACC1TCP9_9APHY|nr:hypothetical protein NM688_g904 [Phlebia brevispora]